MADDSNKRIAQNTMYLYIRMLLTMLISLYTSRIVLSVLGVSDFGLYNVVGGVISMFSMFSGTLAGGTQRFLTYAIGKNDFQELRNVFSISLGLHFAVSGILLILAETIGIWFLYTQLSVPEGRMIASLWVYQFSIIAFIISLIQIPFMSSLIAHEKMNIYAYMSIYDVVMKLLIVFLIQWLAYDKLILYGFLIMLVNVTSILIYISYCIKKFPECHFKFYNDKKLFKQMFSYSGWNLFGAAAGLVKGQGLNILLNMFFDPIVNAARGIAYQINTAIVQFSGNFYTAVKPQITKYYAQNNLDEMFKLIFQSSKMSFYLILLLSLPIAIETPFILLLWLGQIPDYAVIFVRYIIAISAVEAMANPLMTAAHATGRIALYQSLVGTITMLNIPISYIFLTYNFPPVTVFIISLIIAILCLFIRLWIVKRLISLPFWKYSKQVFGKCFFITSISLIIPIITYYIIPHFKYNELAICVLTLFSTIATIYSFGFNAQERFFLFS